MLQVWLLCLIGTLNFTPGILDPLEKSGACKTASFKKEMSSGLEIVRRDFILDNLNPPFAEDSLSCIIPSPVPET